MEEINVLYISKGILNPNGGAESAARKLLINGLLANSHPTDIKLNLYCLTTIEKSLIKGRYKEIKIFSNGISTDKRYKSMKRLFLIPLVKRVPFLTDIILERQVIKQVEYVLSQYPIDLIHIHGYNTFYPILINIPVPIVYTLHDFSVKWPKNPINYFPFNIIEKFWYLYVKKKFNAVIMQSNKSNEKYFFHAFSIEIKKYLTSCGVNSHKILLLPNGTEILPSHKILHKDDRKSSQEYLDGQKRQHEIHYIMYVGDFYNVKNLHSLIKAFTDISSKRRDVRLLIVGRPIPILGNFYIRKIFRDVPTHLKQHIIWIKYVKNYEKLMYLYRKACMVVLPSFSEASPLVPIEALNNDVPIVMTKTGSIPDILENSALSSIVQNPTAENISEACLNLIYEEEKGSGECQISSTGVQSVLTHLTWKNVGKTMADFYKEILRVSFSYTKKL